MAKGATELSITFQRAILLFQGCRGSILAGALITIFCGWLLLTENETHLPAVALQQFI